jgi:orotate phosphoribosyltransferase-like protein
MKLSKGSIIFKVFLVFILTMGIGNSNVNAEAALKIDNALKSKINTIIKNATMDDSNIKKLSGEYQTSLKKQHSAEASLENIKNQYPIFMVMGEVKTWKPFMLWGGAFSSQASYSHIGQRPANSNILIENPDQNKVMYGQYVQGYHYFKRVTTGKGIFGQDVPIYVYGSKPAGITNAENKVNAEKKKVNSAISKITSYVDTKYSKKLKAKPKDETIYVEKAIVQFNLANRLINEDLLSKAFKTIKSVKDPTNSGIFLLYAAENQSSDAKAATYATIAKGRPNLVYNFPTTTNQFYMAGLALKPYKQYTKEAIYCFQKALASKNATIKTKAQSFIKELQKVPVSKIEINSEGSVDVGDSIKLSAVIKPSNATIKTVKWASSNKSIATINQDGLLTGIAKGEVKITASADGKTATTTITVSEVYVSSIPELTVDWLPVSTDQKSITISGSVTDELDQDPQLYVNDEPVYVSYNGDWSEDVDLNEGDNRFVIKAVNSQGKSTTVTKVVKFISQGPVIKINSLASSTDLNTIIISGTVTDKNDPSPKLYVNDKEVYVNYSGTWSENFDLVEGDNTFVIKAVNSQEKSATVTKVVKFTTQAPVLTVNSLASSTDLNTITISGTVTDKNDPSPKLYVNDKEVYVNYSGTWSENFDLVEGENTFVIKSVNSQGKSTTVTKVVRFSSQAPVLTVNSLASSTDLNTITISGMITDKNDQRPKIYVNDKEVYVNYSGTWSESFDLVEGDNTFVIKAVNSQGKSATVTKVVKFTPPTSVLTVNSLASSTDLESITISGMITDKNDQRPKVYVNDKEVYVNYSGTWSESFDLVEGDNTFVIKAVNSQGKSTTVTKVVTFTPPAPVLTVNSLASSTDLESITISGMITDKNDQSPKVYVNDKEVYVNYSGTWSENFSLNKGINTFTIKAINRFGKITIETRTITFN